MYLNCHTYYSYKFGTVKPLDLCGIAVKNGVDCFAHTDINSTSASMEMNRLSHKFGIKVVNGVDFRNGAIQLFVALAQNKEGFREINAYLSKFLTMEQAKIPAIAPDFENVFVVYPYEGYQGHKLKEYEFVGVRPEQLRKFRFHKGTLQVDKCVVLQSVSFKSQAEFNTHKLLRAIDKNTLITKLAPTDLGQAYHRMTTPDRLKAAFADFPIIIQNTQRLLNSCNTLDFGLGTMTNNNQSTYSGSVHSDIDLMRKLVNDGLDYRYRGKETPNTKERIEKEMTLIQQKGFLSYFLISWDITNYARSKGYFYVGRGSGANSLLAYLLRITDVDPIELDLYFERFINLFRRNPPDFDIDFSWTDREDVTQYIFNRFKNTSLVGAYVTFQQKAVIREIGKVFGLPKYEIDKLSNGQIDGQRLDKTSLSVLQYGQLIDDFPSHCSIHSSGILIAEHDLHNYGTTFLPPKGFATSDFDMVIAEDAGLYKFDILGQRGLGKIKSSIDIILNNQQVIVDVHDIKSFKEDPKVNDNLKNAKAIGCFYVESPAMRGLLVKLKVKTYLGLVAASSIIRPGVAQSGMMREYIKRFRDPEERKKAHPILLDIMPETFGVMVYQEDVIKVAHYFAGLSLAESDVLRRGMSGKFKGRTEFEEVKEKYFSNCREKGHSDELATEVWRQIESFGGFAFAKGHSASYAVESYQSLFLKTYYPLEYLVATLNNGGGFYRTEDYIHEARMNGGIIHAPCVNRSEALCTIYGSDIYLGLGFLNELENKAAIGIIENRYQNGAYLSFDDFIDRVTVSVEQVSVLIRADAFRFTGKNKRELLWEAHFKLNKEKKKFKQSSLFKTQHKQFSIPQLENSPLEDAFDQIELLGFALCHPFALLAEKREQHLLARDLPKLNGKVVKIWGYLINTKNTRTSKGDHMNFGCFTDHEGAFFDTTSFPAVAAQFPFRGRGVYEIIGMVADDFGFYSIDAQVIRKIPMISDPRYSDSEQKVPDASRMNFSRKSLNNDIP
ncbi:DNA polymerase III subunit alpha [bacterium]|nr:DNA polymerase III subunit alpha [bacterium]